MVNNSISDDGIEEQTIDIRRYLGLALRYWWVLLIPAVAGGGVGYYASTRAEPDYKASTTILIEYRGTSFTPGTSDVGTSLELGATYQKLITARPFLDQVPHQADISATTLGSPPSLKVNATHPDPNIASDDALSVATKFVDYVVERRLAEIARLQAAAAAYGITITDSMVAAQISAVDSLSLLNPGAPSAKLQVRPVSRDTILGVILGLALGLGLALLAEGLTDTVRSPAELARRFGVTNLGTVFKWSGSDVPEGEVVVWVSPTSTYAESFRQVRANFQFATANVSGNVFMVCSPGPGEGKSTILGNFATALAQGGKSVAIVDGDMRRPSLHRLFSAERREPGLSNYLANEGANLQSMMQSVDVQGVSLLTSGTVPPNPAELLGSPAVPVLLQELSAKFDFVLVDSPPVLPVADAQIMASQVSGVVVVIDSFGTRPSALHATLDSLKATQVNIVGVVMNKMKRSRYGSGYYYHYYYDYSYGYGPDGDTGAVRANGAKGMARRLTKTPEAVWSRVRGRRTNDQPGDSV